jgi:hypothetical protein
MVLNAGLTPQRAPRLFNKWTRLSVQVRGGNTITYGHEQGEVQNPLDGLQLTQASTAPPFDFWWRGEFWYIANNANSPLNFIVVGDADDTFHP